MSPVSTIKEHGAHGLKSHCCSHFGQCGPLKRKHWIWQGCRSQFNFTDLVASHTVLLHLLKFALELSLALHFFLSATHIDELPVQFFAIHLIHSLFQEIKTVFWYPFILWLHLLQEVKYVSLTTFKAELTLCASSCLSKLTNPKPLDFPFSSVMTRMLIELPYQIRKNVFETYKPREKL